MNENWSLHIPKWDKINETIEAGKDHHDPKSEKLRKEVTQEKEGMKSKGGIRYRIKIIVEMKTKLEESQMQIKTMDDVLREIKDEKRKSFS